MRKINTYVNVKIEVLDNGPDITRATAPQEKVKDHTLFAGQISGLTYVSGSFRRPLEQG